MFSGLSLAFDVGKASDEVIESGVCVDDDDTRG